MTGNEKVSVDALALDELKSMVHGCINRKFEDAEDTDDEDVKALLEREAAEEENRLWYILQKLEND